ncbi:DEAD/DEAH box helicase [Raineyella fluvialis]|uniref:DEAD/DEAH box helicase n=1 Tax=Raineyella fluvialis TaxID=2662261 RepID=UPI003BAF2D3E
MSELLPTLQARDIQRGLRDYLTTTFALADSDARRALDDFLSDEHDGIFKGPYVRMRLPYRAAPKYAEPSLEWQPPYPPYAHQATAWSRLTTLDRGPDKPRPLPTLVTTGTGSGKTEAFLYPILDHVLRAHDRGVTGTKALILYPMNALANDQALRLAKLIADPANGLSGVTAALYTGQDSKPRTRVSEDSLITDRGIIRDSAPDILLTNYKMLDQLLLREEDQSIWRQSAESLTYLVLDEFHTYDGAQGTDVAMLLRRLGLTLKSHWAPSTHTEDELTRPLGRMTPVATSATLGDKGDPAEMVGFATTVFGEPFSADDVVTETRVSLDEWCAGAHARVAAHHISPAPVQASLLRTINAAVSQLGEAPEPHDLAVTVLNGLYQPDDPSAAAQRKPLTALADLEALAKAHPLVRSLIEHAVDATSLASLATELVPLAGAGPDLVAQATEFLTDLVGALSHLRAQLGRGFVTMETHLWVRELTRIDRLASTSPGYRWSDDGVVTGAAGGVTGDPGAVAFPAVYCRHCGRSGWGVGLGPTGTGLDHDDKRIRADHAAGNGRFRALIRATSSEAEHLAANPGENSEFGWFSVRGRELTRTDPGEEERQESDYLPVLTHWGDNADDASRQDTCPACQKDDGIRFLGSAIATQLSVTLSGLFGTDNLDPAEKKALVFTDSVQDAAHRAGFIESRSHTLTLRAALRASIGPEPATLKSLVATVLSDAGKDPFRRYRLLPPDVVGRDDFSAFWRTDASGPARVAATRRVESRLLFDTVLEFGLQARLGRTLELTGSVAAQVDAGMPAALANIARQVIKQADTEPALFTPLDQRPDDMLVRWVRGVLEHMRTQGSIAHKWFDKYIENDGNRWMIWGGRPKGQGMPAFPKGRSAPGFPRVGGAQLKGDPLLDPVTSPQSWYSRWANKTLGVTPQFGARLSKALLQRLADAGILTATTTKSSATVYAIPTDRVLVSELDLPGLQAGRYRLHCSVCHTEHPGTAETVDQLVGAPCLMVRCSGTLDRAPIEDNYYRHLYDSSDMRRVVAREHTSLVPDTERLAREGAFRSSRADSSAPNVLVATPTLEMGIDIGDLSAVFLASLPRTVASYVQRVGRAGRLTGNALDMAFVTGRGEHLPRLGDPLSMINGAVRPPATYLSAEEMLQRQYLAHILDEFARDPGRAHPRLAEAVMASTEPGTFLGDLVTYAEQNAGPLLERFLSAFDDLLPAAVANLRAWATPGEAPRNSGLAAMVVGASGRWARTVQELRQRKLTIQKEIPDLRQRAEVPAATEDDKRDLRIAEATLKMTNGQIAELTTDHWIGTLEAYGILPNYTLVDDSVHLDVSVSWLDPDSQTYESDSFGVDRSGGATPLREFAPGATFYVHGLEVAIDAVDLGPNASAIRAMAMCSECGYVEDMALSGHQQDPQPCPRCGSSSTRDTGNHVPVVELKRVTAAVRRDEALISDRSDERRQVWFGIVPAIDVDPAEVAEQWYVKGYDFGVKYLRRMTLRWFNVGEQGEFGQKRRIAGKDMVAPLFRVCVGCGCRDLTAKSNSRNEHRPWCAYRTSSDEHVEEIALSRTLQTQGAMIPLPISVTTGDPFAIPSLSAALKLGLREQFGGAPDHIGVAEVPDPVSTELGTREALVLYDTVPGGTGYLAELSDPARVHDLLYQAWRKVAECPCRDEERLACHRCLLPLAAGRDIDRVSRQAAERHLGAILTAGRLDEPEPDLVWDVTVERPPADPSMSPLELRFAELFRALLEDLNATVQDVPGTWGNTIRANVRPRRWTLEPQVPVLNSKPDFVLRSDDTNVPPVAIFTDGLAYHASVAVNRLADDAGKRSALAEAGYLVLSVTAADVSTEEKRRADERITVAAPEWFDEAQAGVVANHGQYQSGDYAVVTGGPFAFLRRWIRAPYADAQRRMADHLPMIFATSTQAVSGVVTANQPAAEQARRILQGGSPGVVVGETVPAWWWHRGPLVVFSRLMPADSIEVVAMVDDRPSAVGSAGFPDAWWDWLTVANGLQGRQMPTTITTLERMKLAAAQKASGPAPAASVPASGTGGLRAEVFTPGWKTILDGALEDERSLGEELARAGLRTPDAMGDEVGDTGIPAMFLWEVEHVVVLRDLVEQDVEDLRTRGWTVLGPEATDIEAALSGAADRRNEGRRASDGRVESDHDQAVEQDRSAAAEQGLRLPREADRGRQRPRAAYRADQEQRGSSGTDRPGRPAVPCGAVPSDRRERRLVRLPRHLEPRRRDQDRAAD